MVEYFPENFRFSLRNSNLQMGWSISVTRPRISTSSVFEADEQPITWRTGKKALSDELFLVGRVGLPGWSSRHPSTR